MVIMCYDQFFLMFLCVSGAYTLNFQKGGRNFAKLTTQLYDFFLEICKYFGPTTKVPFCSLSGLMPFRVHTLPYMYI